MNGMDRCNIKKSSIKDFLHCSVGHLEPQNRELNAELDRVVLIPLSRPRNGGREMGWAISASHVT